MILMGNYMNIPNQEQVDDLVLYNLSSPIMGFQVVDLLPPYELEFTYDNTFDKIYYDYIINNDNKFMNLMAIIMNEYHNRNTYIIVSEGQGYDYINESLMKLIQVRYGIIVQYINDKSDYEMLRDDTDISFSIFGMESLMIDKERYALIYTETNQIIE